MNKKTSRRDFIKNSAAGSIATAAMFNKFLITMTASLPFMVQANEITQIMNYLCLWTGGGPARRFFDLPLIHENSKFNFSSEMGNQITNYNNPKDFNTKYTTINYKGLSLPYLNSASIPTVGGGTAKMYELFANALIIRGVVLPTAGHAQNTELFMRPNSSASTIQAIVAENSNAPFPSVDIWSGLPYVSLKGKGRVMATEAAPMMSLLQNFNNNYSHASSYQMSDIESKIDSLLNVFQKKYETSNPNIAKIYGDRVTAKNILKSNLGAFIDQYDVVFQKYFNLIDPSFRKAKLAGVFDPIPTRLPTESKTTSGHYNVGNGGVTGIIQNEFVNELIGPSAQFDGLARSMAMSEILLKEKLSQSICVNTGEIWGLKAIFDGNVREIGNGHDSHGWGAYLIFYLENLYFYGLATGLTELVNVLKNTNVNGMPIYDNTLIQFASEFPGAFNYSDGQTHQPNGQCTTLFSGRFKNPLVVGNISLGGRTDGDGAPVEALGNRYMNNGNMASTVAEIIGVKSPTPNDSSVAMVDANGNLISKIGPAQTIG